MTIGGGNVKKVRERNWRKRGGFVFPNEYQLFITKSISGEKFELEQSLVKLQAFMLSQFK